MVANIPEIAFRKGFHRMVEQDMGRECRAMLNVPPTCTFEELEAGKSYCFKPSYGNHPMLVEIEQTTPKRRQAVARVNHGEPRRIYRGDYYGNFIELNADLSALTGVTHEMIVTAAVRAGMDIPPESAGSIQPCLSKSPSGLPTAVFPPWSG